MYLTHVVKGEIISLHKQGFNTTEISKKTNISINTASFWINRYYISGNLNTINVRERKGKLSLKQVFKIIEYVSLNECTVEEIIKEFDLKISKGTLKNILKSTYHRYGKNKRKPLLTEQRKNRVDWCKLYYLFDMYLVEFSDEMSIWKYEKQNEHGHIK